MRPSIINTDLTERIKEIRRAEGRQPIEIAGPAGNPTQPKFCSHCGAGAFGAHNLDCPNYVAPQADPYYDYGC